MKQYVVDAFTDKPFHGNPAAVLVMDRWISDETMQAIAAENNLAGAFGTDRAASPGRRQSVLL